MSFSINCDYCPAPNTLMSFGPALGQALEAFEAAWKRVAGSYMVECPTCGAQFGLEDDLAQSVKQTNMSKPKINYLAIGSGARTGGEAIYIYGEALDIGALVVKFGGKPVISMADRSATRVRVVTPIGQYTLNIVSVTTPGFIVGEGVRGLDSGARASIISVAPFVVDFPLAAFTSGEEIQGDASGAKAILDGTPYSGAVDVTVENEHGKRVSGSTLTGGFIYL